MSSSDLKSDPAPSAKEIVSTLVEHIDAVAKHAHGSDRRDAHEALHVILTMIETVRDCAQGKISPPDTEAELTVLKQSIVDAADPPPLPPPPIDDRFDPGSS
jgi:hypothetical protein